MRYLTGAIVVVAIAVILAVAVSLRMSPPAERMEPVAVAPAARPQGERADQGAPSRRSARVEERLGRLRDDYERRKVEKVEVVPSNRGAELPHRDVVMPPSANDQLDPSYPSDLDPDEYEEFDSIRETLLHDADPDERIGAVLMLTGMEGEPAWRLLVDAMQDPDAEVRLAVVEALGDYSDDISPDILVPALNDADAEVRFEAYGILGDMENTDAMALVRGGLDDPDEDVRALAEGILDFADEE
jgi:hypothetical protein